jgi:hypothetical protein
VSNNIPYILKIVFGDGAGEDSAWLYNSVAVRAYGAMVYEKCV